jgi:hypothetical protein
MRWCSSIELWAAAGSHRRLEYWNDGVVECCILNPVLRYSSSNNPIFVPVEGLEWWSKGVVGLKPNPLILQYSNNPIFLAGPGSARR